MRKGPLMPLAVVAALLVLAFLSNPSPERHRAKIREAVAQRSQLAKALGVGPLTAFASRYHSLGIASYSTVGDRTVSYGVLGLVFVDV